MEVNFASMGAMEAILASMEVNFASANVFWKCFFHGGSKKLLFHAGSLFSSVGVRLLPWLLGSQGDWWASGGSCGGLIIFSHLVSGSRVPNWKGPPRGQGTIPSGSRAVGKLVEYPIDADSMDLYTTSVE